MNGYFNNLALRTMNAGNLVEPRLPSLFEPQRSELDAATQIHSEPPPALIDARPTESPQPAVSIEEAAVSEEVIREQPVGTTARSSSKDEVRRITPVRATHEDHTAPAATPVAESPALVTEIPPVETLSTTQSAPQAPQIKTPIAPKSEIKSVKSVSPQPERAERSTITKVTAETFPAPQSRIETETTSAVEEHVSIVEEQDVYFEPAPTFETLTLPTTEVTPQLVERVIEKSRNTDKTSFRSATRSIRNYAWLESEAPEPEPSINITIGRVEVRAAPAANTKPARTRQESPVMPLDEYLRKQRRGGER